MKTTAEAAVFSRIIAYAVQQRLMPRPFEVDELFDETTFEDALARKRAQIDSQRISISSSHALL